MKNAQPQPVTGASIYQREGAPPNKWWVSLKIQGIRRTKAFNLPYQDVVEWTIAAVRANGRRDLKMDTLPEHEIRPELFPTSLFPSPPIKASIQEMVSQYEQILESKAGTKAHVLTTIRQLKALLDLASIVRAEQITETAIRLALGKLVKRQKSFATINHHLTAIKGFCRWAAKPPHGLQSGLLDGIQKYAAAADQRRSRTCFTFDEFCQLMNAAMHGPEWRGIAGIHRAALYLAAAATGLRQGALVALTVDAFKFGDAPFVQVSAAIDKGKKRRTLDLRPDHAAWLQNYFGNKMPSARAFKSPRHQCDIVRMLRADMKAAEIEMAREIKDGEIIRLEDVKDFHSLRHSHLTWCAMSGATPQTVQRRAGHSTVDLTMRIYTHIPSQDMLRALDGLPPIPVFPGQTAVRNGVAQ